MKNSCHKCGLDGVSFKMNIPPWAHWLRAGRLRERRACHPIYAFFGDIDYLKLVIFKEGVRRNF